MMMMKKVKRIGRDIENPKEFEKWRPVDATWKTVLTILMASSPVADEAYDENAI